MQNIKEIQEYVREKCAKAAIDGFGEPCLTLVNYPLTLSRVLSAIKRAMPQKYYVAVFATACVAYDCVYFLKLRFGEEIKTMNVGTTHYLFGIVWITNKKGKEFNFEDQNFELQLAVAELLGYKPNNTAQSVDKIGRENE